MRQSKSGSHKMTLVESAASSAVKMACDIGAPAIIVLSQSGETARLLAKFHPSAKIIAVCNDVRVANQVEGNMCNTMSVLTDSPRGEGRHVMIGFEAGKKKGLFKDGDCVIAVHTMRNADNVKQWAVRILNVTSSASPAHAA
jgi:pyruvate kinase